MNSHLLHFHVAIPTDELNTGQAGGNKECERCFSAWWDEDATSLSLSSCEGLILQCADRNIFLFCPQYSAILQVTRSFCVLILLRASGGTRSSVDTFGMYVSTSFSQLSTECFDISTDAQFVADSRHYLPVRIRNVKYGGSTVTDITQSFLLSTTRISKTRDLRLLSPRSVPELPFLFFHPMFPTHHLDISLRV